MKPNNKILSKFSNGTFYELGSNLNKLRTFSPIGGVRGVTSIERFQ